MVGISAIEIIKIWWSEESWEIENSVWSNRRVDHYDPWVREGISKAKLQSLGGAEMLKEVSRIQYHRQWGRQSQKSKMELVLKHKDHISHCGPLKDRHCILLCMKCPPLEEFWRMVWSSLPFKMTALAAFIKNKVTKAEDIALS